MFTAANVRHFAFCDWMGEQKMKFNKNRASRAVAYAMSALMIGQTLLSPVCTAYANAVDESAIQQQAAQNQKDTGGECL